MPETVQQSSTQNQRLDILWVVKSERSVYRNAYFNCFNYVQVLTCHCTLGEYI